MPPVRALTKEGARFSFMGSSNIHFCERTSHFCDGTEVVVGFETPSNIALP